MNSEDLDDDDLTRRAAAGDRWAFERLWERHEITALRIASAVLRSRNEVDDALASVFGMFVLGIRDDASSVFHEPLQLGIARATAAEVLKRVAAQTTNDPGAFARRDLVERQHDPGRLMNWPLNANAVDLYERLPVREIGQPWEAAPGWAAPLVPEEMASSRRIGVQEFRNRLLAHHDRYSMQLICRQVGQHLDVYLTGRLRGAKERTVVDHLERCGRCQDVASIFRRSSAGADVRSLIDESGIERRRSTVELR